MNKKRLKELLVSNRDAIRLNLDGTDSRDETLEKYINILSEYNTFYDELRVTGYSGFIRGILYQHNSENFSKLTAIYLFEEESLNMTDYYGDDTLLRGLRDVISRDVDLKKDSQFTEIKISEMDNLPFHLYCYTIIIRDRTVVFTSISSSHYFDKNKFTFTAGIVRNLYDRENMLVHPYSIDYFSDMLKEIDETIKENINDKNNAEGHFYVFKSIEEIFKNSSISTYSDITGVINNVFKKHHGSNSRIFMVSLTRFLVIEIIEDHEDDRKAVNGKINVTYKELPLPYEAITIKLNDYTSVYNLWEKFSLFYNYVTSGDQS